MMRKFGLYLLANNQRAAIAALIFALLPLVMVPTGFVAVVIVGLVTLRQGLKPGLMVMAFALLPAIAFLIVNRVQLFYGYDFLLVSQCMLVTVFALILRRTAAWRFILETATILGCLVVLSMHYFIPDVKAFWIHLYNQVQGLENFHRAMVIPDNLLQSATAMASGVIAFILLFGVFVQLLLARWWETSIYSPGALRTEFNRIRISRVFALLLLVATVGLYWKQVWLIDVYPVLLLPFTVGALSILSKLTTLNKRLILVSMLVYFVLLILPFYTIIFLTMIGFIDSWFDFRKRLAWLK